MIFLQRERAKILYEELFGDMQIVNSLEFPTEKEVGLESKVILRKTNDITSKDYGIFLKDSRGIRRIGYIFREGSYKETKEQYKMPNGVELKKY